MNFKEMLHRMLIGYFVLVTCILAAIMATGMIFEPDAQLGYRSLAAPFLYALLGIIPISVMYSPKELSDRQLIIRKVIQLIITEAEIMTYFILNPTINTSEPKRIISLAVSIFLVYAAANLVNLISSYFTAQKMTKDLLDFQKNAK